MNLSHLLVNGIRADREMEIANRRLVRQLTGAKAENPSRTTRPTSRLRRLLPAN